MVIQFEKVMKMETHVDEHSSVARAQIVQHGRVVEEGEVGPVDIDYDWIPDPSETLVVGF